MRNLVTEFVHAWREADLYRPLEDDHASSEPFRRVFVQPVQFQISVSLQGISIIEISFHVVLKLAEQIVRKLMLHRYSVLGKAWLIF
jgi:hypothetical protein